jgi:hypothetical protein
MTEETMTVVAEAVAMTVVVAKTKAQAAKSSTLKKMPVKTTATIEEVKAASATTRKARTNAVINLLRTSAHVMLFLNTT